MFCTIESGKFYLLRFWIVLCTDDSVVKTVLRGTVHAYTKHLICMCLILPFFCSSFKVVISITLSHLKHALKNKIVKVCCKHERNVYQVFSFQSVFTNRCIIGQWAKKKWAWHQTLQTLPSGLLGSRYTLFILDITLFLGNRTDNLGIACIMFNFLSCRMFFYTVNGG